MASEEEIKFEKYKIHLELIKWFIGSVALVLITAIIDTGLKKRAINLQEMQEYGKYVNEIIVLNPDVKNRRLLAQFFSEVTVSEDQKEKWRNYYLITDKEYRKIYEPIITKDSLDRIKLIKITNQTKQDSTIKVKIETLQNEIEKNQQQLSPEPFVLPEPPTPNKTSKVNSKDYNVAKLWEQKGFKALLDHNVEDAIIAFNNADNAYPKFHQAFEISQFLSSNKAQLAEKNSQDWQETKKFIAINFNWRMPVKIKKQLMR